MITKKKHKTKIIYSVQKYLIGYIKRLVGVDDGVQEFLQRLPVNVLRENVSIRVERVAFHSWADMQFVVQIQFHAVDLLDDDVVEDLHAFEMQII